MAMLKLAGRGLSSLYFSKERVRLGLVFFTCSKASSLETYLTFSTPSRVCSSLVIFSTSFVVVVSFR